MKEAKIILVSLLAVFLLMGCVSNSSNPSASPSSSVTASVLATATPTASQSESVAPSIASTNEPTASPTASAGNSSSEVKTVRIDAYNFGFNVTGPSINKGDKVKLIVKSSSGTHGFAIPGLSIDLKPIAAGEEKTTEFTADQSGDFDFYCNIPCGEGHSTMKGKLNVN